MKNLDELLQQQAELNRLIEDAKKAEKGIAINQCQELIRRFGLTAKDLNFTATVGKQKRTSVPKYNINGQLWGGRGSQKTWPKFVKDAVQQLGSIEAVRERFRIK